MARSHSHFFRLNPVAPRSHRAPVDPLGVTAFLFDLPAILFWATWSVYVVLGIQAPFRLVFSPTILHRPMLYVLNLGLPLIGLFLGLISFNQRRRKSDLGSLAVPLSLLLLGAGLLYSVARLYSA